MGGVAETGSWALDMAGESGRTGGVPNRGGDVPNEWDSAAARAEMPGPAVCDPGPGNGINGLDSPSSPAAGVEMDDVPGLPDGIGEARRAIDSARGTEVPYDRGRNEPCDGEPGRPGVGESLPEFDIIQFLARTRRSSCLQHVPSGDRN